MRINLARCDRCKAEYRYDTGTSIPPAFPRQIKVNIPIKHGGFDFHNEKDLCLACREGLKELVKNYVEELK